jgi:hypothetical protein
MTSPASSFLGLPEAVASDQAAAVPSAPIPTRDDDFDLVAGDTPAIEKTLDWLKRVDQQVKDTAAALRAALDADQLLGEARQVVLARVHDTAHNLEQLLADESFRSVVSDKVSSWVSPLLSAAAVSCRDLARATEDGVLPDELLDRWLVHIKATRFELPLLGRLLVIALVGRRRCDDSGSPAPIASKVQPRLTERRKLMLIEMLALGAIGNRKKVNRGDVVDRIDKGKTAEDFARDFGALKQLGLTNSEAGPDGGVWLTAQGKAAAEELMKQ